VSDTRAGRGGRRATGQTPVDPGPPTRPTSAVVSRSGARSAAPTGADGHPTGPTSWVERVVAGHTRPGHRGRWGVAWFAIACAALAVGPVAIAVVFALVAGVAGLQTAAAWGRGRRAAQLVAGVGAAALPLAAVAGTGLLGLASILFGVVALVVGLRARPARGRRVAPLALAGIALRSGWWLGFGAACAVVVGRTDRFALLILLVLVSAYEVGDYLVGTGAGTPVEGPIAGVVAVAVLTFTLSVFQLGPFDTQAAWVFGGLAAVLTPLGPMVASTFVPTASAGGPALRRLDSWILVAPAWMWMLWNYLG